ncbi:MAG: SMEK domain-containing protein [Fibrobacter sp.]|nr:SMEK domain-containing protein [Fibrobacter sp.]
MNRDQYISSIIHKLATLATEVEIRGHLNLLDIHVHAETFYSALLNTIFDLQLSNANVTKSNVSGIDLTDSVNKVLFQVSSRNDATKIQSSLQKINTSDFAGFSFKYQSISKDASNLRNKDFRVPQGITFNPQKDIYDINSLATIIKNIDDISKIESIYDFCQNELVEKMSIRPLLITEVINKLAENSQQSNISTTQLPFEIEEKIVFNSLKRWKISITEMATYSSKVGKIYATFDAEGQNKSNAVLHSLGKTYQKLKETFSGDELFDKLLEKVYADVDGDSYCSEIIAKELLEYNISIVLVDAFMRCKIFERPD